jgi:hypothetical protein
MQFNILLSVFVLILFLLLTSAIVFSDFNFKRNIKALFHFSCLFPFFIYTEFGAQGETSSDAIRTIDEKANFSKVAL